MLPVSIPYIAKNQKDYVNDCLERNWISAFGKYDDLLTNSFAEYIGTKYASTCTNGTVALHLALLSVGVKPGDEVIITNFNGPYALFSCGYVNAIPVIVDINDEWDVEIETIEKAISPSTRAIIIPHLYGIPSRINRIKDLCNKNNIFIIEDCAEAHGAQEEDKKVGSIGDVGCFSFYANKIIASGEGGILTTSNKEIYEKINYFKNQTFNPEPIKTFIHKDIGYNYRMSDIHCAIAYSHLLEIDEILKSRNEIIKMYKRNLPGFEESFQFTKENITNVNWVTTLELKDKNHKANRDALERFLYENGIQSRKFFATMANQPIFKNMKGRISGDISVSEDIAKSGIYLPTYIGIEEKDVKIVCKNIIKFFEGL